jgi:hypothetical protein
MALEIAPHIVVAERLVWEWAQNYQRDLLDMWRTQQFRPLPGLE